MERLVDPTIVRLSGADVIGIEIRPCPGVEVRQYHADYQDGAPTLSDEYGGYEIAEAVSGTTPVTAGSSPGLAAEHRGVRAWATIGDLDGDEGDAHHVVVRCFVEPPPRGLDRNVYSATFLAPPAGHVYQPVEGTGLVAMDKATHDRLHRGEDPHRA